jgi:omega-amidase
MLLLLVQYSIFWELPKQNTSHISAMLEQYKPNNALIVLPEMFSTGFTMKPEKMAENMDGETINWMKNTAIHYNSTIAGSIIIREGGQYFNRFVWISPNGSISFYNKRHLFRMGGENNAYSAGNERVILNFDGFRILPQVCYDLRFPVWSRNQNDYDLIVYSANWPETRQHVWNTLLKARAIENQAYVVGVNRIGNDGMDLSYIGNSQVIDFKGNVLADAGSNESILAVSIHVDELNSFKKSFPVWMDADGFSVL